MACVGLRLTGSAAPTCELSTLPLDGTPPEGCDVPPEGKVAPGGTCEPRTLPRGGTPPEGRYVPPEGKVGW